MHTRVMQGTDTAEVYREIPEMLLLLHVIQERKDIPCKRSSNQHPKLFDESPPYVDSSIVAVPTSKRTERLNRSLPESTPFADMAAQKRKRSDLKGEDGQDGSGTRTGGMPRKTYKTGKEVQSAIEFASKDCE